MAKSQALRDAEARNIALDAQLVDAQAKIVALEARLVVAKTVYRDQRAKIEALESTINTRGVKHNATPVITYYTDKCGVQWEKTRIGNKASSRPAVQH